MSIAENITRIKGNLPPDVTLVAVSKTKPPTMVLEAYQAGQRIFGENYVQELVAKQQELPADIQWHFIGHLQSNKVKYIAPFVALIHGVDKESLLSAINKEAAKCNRKIACLLQVHIAQEETKFGLNELEVLGVLDNYIKGQYPNVVIQGLMGMASFTDDENLLDREFSGLKALFSQCKKQYALPEFTTLSMGMSGDYNLAVVHGSTMVRIGSSIFGSRV